MPFKIKRIVSDKQLFRAKWVSSIVSIFTVLALCYHYVQPVEAADEIEWDG